MAMLMIDLKGKIYKVPHCDRCKDYLIPYDENEWICANCDLKNEKKKEILKGETK